MTQPAAIAASAGGQSPQICRHHWMIALATGPVSPGVCQTCGAVREFNNSIVSDLSWGYFNLSPSYRADSAEGTAGFIDYYRENNEEEE